MSTWDSSNVQKWISSSPVFFHSPPTSFTNNVLCIDRSSYHPKITLELFFITIHILEVTPLGLSSTYHATIFRFYRASSQVTLRKKSQEWQQTQIDEPILFRASLLPRLFESWKQIRTRGAGACQRLLSTKKKLHCRMHRKMPFCS